MAKKRRQKENFFDRLLIHSAQEARKALLVGGWVVIGGGLLLIAGHSFYYYFLALISVTGGVLVLRGSLGAVLVVAFVWIGLLAATLANGGSAGILGLIILYYVNRMAMARGYILRPPNE